VSGLYTTGTVRVGAAVAAGAFRAFRRGWVKSRDERRQREELLARLAADMREVAGRTRS